MEVGKLTRTAKKVGWVAVSVAAGITVSDSSSAAQSTNTIVTPNQAYWQSALNTDAIAQSQIATFNGMQYIGYYDVNLNVIIAVRDLATNVVVNIPTGLTMPPASPGWFQDEPHRDLALELDTSGYIHLEFGTHQTALNYYISTKPENPGSFSRSIMLGTPNEAYVTFPMFFKNQKTGALYFTYNYEPSFTDADGDGDQMFYSYDATARKWSAAAGTGAAGLLLNGRATSPPGNSTSGPFLDGLPRWDSKGNLWWVWCWATYLQNGTPDTCVSRNIIGWNGASFITRNGAPQAMPATPENVVPFFATPLGAAAQQMYPQSEFSIDANDTIFDSFAASVNAGGASGNIWHIYVAESSTGRFVTHEIATDDTEPGIVSVGTCTYVVYAAAYTLAPGTQVVQSCDNFASHTSSTLNLHWNPNWTMNADEDLVSSGRISFLFMNSNYDIDVAEGSYVTASTPNVGELFILDWYPSSSPSP